MSGVLNFPSYPFTVRSVGQSKEIFDAFRKKFVSLTPEEWVRQHFLRFLAEEKGFPAIRIAVEGEIKIGKIKKRFDAVVYSPSHKPVVLIECKAPGVDLNQKVIDQASRYNLALSVPFIGFSNGLKTFFLILDQGEKSYRLVKEIPDYDKIIRDSGFA